MKPVDQTKFGDPGGNCFSACVASLLDIALEEVPYFMGDDQWFERFAAWLKPRGFYPLRFIYSAPLPAGLYIMGGQSARGSHAVVGRGDPHPSRDGLLEREDCIVLVPFDPIRASAKRVWRKIGELFFREQTAGGWRSLCPGVEREYLEDIFKNELDGLAGTDRSIAAEEMTAGYLAAATRTS